MTAAPATAQALLKPPFLNYKFGRAYDEMFERPGVPREHYQALYRTLLESPPEELRTLRPVKSTFEYEVWVLQTDIERARPAIEPRTLVGGADDAITCLDDVPDFVRLAARQQFLNKWYHTLGLVPFGIFLFIEFEFDPNSNNRILVGLVVLSLIWAGAVAGYAFYLLVAFRCPACKNRFGLGENCRSCYLPRHRDSAGILANSR
jgi:hypothetical protein